MLKSPNVISDAILALGAVVLAFFVSALPGLAHAQDKSESLRAEVGRPLSAAQDLIKAQKFAEALAKLQEADAVAAKTPYESYVLERLRATAASGAGDIALAEKSFGAVLASNRLPAAEQAQVFGSLAVMFYRAKDYPKTAQWATRYVNAGGSNPQIREVLIQSLYLSNDFAGATREMLAEIKADEAAGKVPGEDRLELLASSYLKAKDEAGYTTALEKLVALYPKKDYWADLINRIQKKPGFASRLSLDVFRLQRSAAGLRDASDFMEMAQLASEGGFPIEAKKILDEGFSANVLGTGPDAARQKRLRDTVNKQAAEDVRVLAQGPSSATAAKDGTGLVNSGLDYVFNGQFDKGLPLMEQGIAKGGLKQPEDAKLRLGMGYYIAGQKDKAIQTLKTVQGVDGTADLARLWVLHLQRS
jgi:hypothetical protein